jgi:hypothetical protein
MYPVMPPRERSYVEDNLGAAISSARQNTRCDRVMRRRCDSLSAQSHSNTQLILGRVSSAPA